MCDVKIGRATNTYGRTTIAIVFWTMAPEPNSEGDTSTTVDKMAMVAAIVPQNVETGFHGSTQYPMTLSPSASPTPTQRTGRWTPDEKILFLYGLKRFGKGRWKKMSVYLPHRSLVQIKSHAQKVLKRLEAGENVFRRLEENYNIVDSLIAQAAKQHQALDNQLSRNLPKSTLAKRKQNTLPDDAVPSYSQLFSNGGQTSPPKPPQVDGDVAALAASALCQLSSLNS